MNKLSNLITPSELTTSSSTTSTTEISTEQEFIRDSKFWLVFLSLCVASFLSALDLTAVSTVLPTIAQEFDSNEFSYVGSLYALTSTAFIPWTGGIASIFGRKTTMLGSLLFFAVGSAVVAAAPNMGTVLCGRSLQGVGGGGILTMTEIVVVDMIPLAQRGLYFGILGSVWAISSAVGPSLGGVFASANAWRWLFWMNLPISAIAAVLVACFMNLKAPETTWKEKAAMMDYYNILFVLSATSTILGLTWAGIGGKYTWTSVSVIVPIILGILGMILFFYIEKVYVKHPTVPFDILRHPTSLLGYLTTILHGIIVMSAVYYLPVFYQSVKNSSALEAGIDLFSLSFTIAPFAIIGGAAIAITKNYKISNLLTWAFCMLGFGLSTLLTAYTSKAVDTTIVVLIGIGLGLGYAAISFAVLAPLRTEQQPHAAAFLAFTRSFGQVLGITIGGTILNSQLAIYLPIEYLNMIGGSADSAFAAIPEIRFLSEPLQSLVQEAFANSLRRIWWFSLILAAIGFLATCFMKEIKMGETLDSSEWGIKRTSSDDLEKSLKKEVVVK